MMSAAIAAITKWWVARKIAIILYGVAIAAFSFYSFYLVQWGRNIEKAKCDVAAKDALIKTLQSDLQLAQARAERAEGVQRTLNDMRNKSQLRVWELEKELKDAEERKKAKKPDPNAILDDDCRYTPFGAKRVR